MTFCVQEAYDRKCHEPCHAAEPTASHNAEKKLCQKCSQTHTYTTHTQIPQQYLQIKRFLLKELCIIGLKVLRFIYFIH